MLVTLVRPRQIRILVIREDAPGSEGIQQFNTGVRGFTGNNVQVGRSRGTGDVVELPAYQNDILTALARTGGLPGTDAAAEVIVQRGQGKSGAPSDPPAYSFESLDKLTPIDFDGNEVIRIPLRIQPGESVPFNSPDAELRDKGIDLSQVHVEDN